jgi:Mn-dependent DtxR family transcriptional regulator
MTNYEQAVIRAVAAGPEPVGWYKIEQRLSREELDVREYLPDVLARLESLGFIRRDASGAVSLTESGREAIQ